MLDFDCSRRLLFTKKGGKRNPYLGLVDLFWLIGYFKVILFIELNIQCQNLQGRKKRKTNLNLVK